MSKQRLLKLAMLVESNGLPFTGEQLRALAGEWEALEAELIRLRSELASRGVDEQFGVDGILGGK
jgi:hypothetical protein